MTLTVKIRPRNSVVGIGFLLQHGFNIGPLTTEGFHLLTLQPENSGSICTRSALERLQQAPKIDPSFEFEIEDFEPVNE